MQPKRHHRSFRFQVALAAAGRTAALELSADRRPPVVDPASKVPDRPIDFEGRAMPVVHAQEGLIAVPDGEGVGVIAKAGVVVAGHPHVARQVRKAACSAREALRSIRVRAGDGDPRGRAFRVV